MRRKDRECNDESFYDEVFATAATLFLAIRGADYPYCIPVNFAKNGTRLYLHSAREGLKLDLLAKDARVGFAAAIDIEIDTASATTYYKSICGQGRAEIVTNPVEKQEALALISNRYHAKCKMPTPEALLDRTAIIRIDIVNLSGKCNQRKN